MTFGKTDGRWVLTSHPSGMPEGRGATGHDPAAADDWTDALGAGVVPPEPDGEHAATMTMTAQTSANETERVMPEA